MSRFSAFVFFSVYLVFCVKKLQCGPTKTNLKLSDAKIGVLREFGEHLKTSTIDPCVDYHSYVCDNANITEKVFQMQKLQDLDSQELILELLKSKEMNNVEIKLMDYLTSCRERSEQDYEKFIRNFNFSNSIGGWPAFDPNWKEENFDLASAIAEMRSYLIPVLINPKFMEDEQGAKRYFSLKLDDASFLDNDDSRKELTDNLSKLGVNQPNEIVQQCTNFEKKYSEIMSSFNTENVNKFTINYSGLKERFPKIDWDKHFKTIAGRVPTDSYPIVIDNLDAITKTFNAVSGMDAKFVANYFFCHFVHKIFTETMILPNNDACFDKTFVYFNKHLSFLTLKKCDTDDCKNQFVGMMQSIISTMGESLKIFEEASAEEIKKEINAIIIDEYISNLSEEIIEKEFEPIAIEYNTFLANEFNLIRHKAKILSGYFYDMKYGRLKYVYYILPAIFLRFMQEFDRQPSPILYELISQDTIIRTVNLLKNDFSASTRECLQKQISAEEIENRSLQAALISEIYFRAYIDWADHNEVVEAENQVLKEYGITSEQLLFANSIQKYCGEKKVLVLSFLWNLKDFSDVYSCPSGSPMNPNEKCTIV